jgi:hypothetical protein
MAELDKVTLADVTRVGPPSTLKGSVRVPLSAIKKAAITL